MHFMKQRKEKVRIFSSHSDDDSDGGILMSATDEQEPSNSAAMLQLEQHGTSQFHPTLPLILHDGENLVYYEEYYPDPTSD